VSSVISTTPREPHGFLRPKLLVAALILLALLAVLCAALLREATIVGPTATTAPQSSVSPPRPAFTPVEEAYAQALWVIHADVKHAAYNLTFGGLRYKLKQADGSDFGTRVREASRTLDRAEARVRAVARSDPRPVSRRRPALPAIRSGDAEGHCGRSRRASAGRLSAQSASQRRTATRRRQDLAR